MIRFLLFLSLFGSLFFLGPGCANIVPPQGGPRDSIPPRIVAAESSPNFQTRLRPESIELTFDEWVRLQDVAGQIVVSPPLEYNFDVRLRRRTVVFSFDEREVLRDSATYVINFGEAVEDLTEGNAAEDLRFVFSTGPVIDSLSVSGRVVDAYSGDPVQGVLFMLYENLADSVVRTERPFYFARTDSAGRFRVSNVKEGLFRGLALDDAGADYRYTLPAERVGFPDSLIRVDSDTASAGLIRMYTPVLPLRLQRADSSAFGRLDLAFSRPPGDLSWEAEGLPGRAYSEVAGDTLRIFYSDPPPGGWTLLLQQDTIFRDTLAVPAGNPEELLSDTLRVVSRPVSTLNPTLPYGLGFSRPLQSIDSNLIALLADSTLQPVNFTAAIDSIGGRELQISRRWQGGQTYRLQLLPGAVTDIYGRQLQDTITRNFQAAQRADYGNIRLTFTAPDSATAYVVKVIQGTDRQLQQFSLQGQLSYERPLEALPPGDYRLEIITDLNGDGRYTPGDYDTGRQPEPVSIRPLEKLRANWDLEVEVEL